MSILMKYGAPFPSQKLPSIPILEEEPELDIGVLQAQIIALEDSIAVLRSTLLQKDEKIDLLKDKIKLLEKIAKLQEDLRQC